MGKISGDVGTVGILNVGAGDTKLSFDKSNPQECIRAARIVADMLKRGYALMIEVEQPNGSKTFQRVLEFREDVCEYVIADLDPVAAAAADKEEQDRGQQAAAPTNQEGPAESGEEAAAASAPKRGRRRNVPASEARGVAVARSAGG
jgi:hypothetical protein